MSQDIRSYFTTIFKKTVSPTNKEETNSKKRSVSSLNSSSDDIVPDTPKEKKRVKKNADASQPKRRRIVEVISDSDSDNETSKKAKPKPSVNPSHEKENLKTPKKKNELKEPKNKNTDSKETKKKVSPLDAFGSEPVKQDKIKGTELNIHDDPDFEKTLLDLDEDELIKSAAEASSAEETVSGKTEKRAQSQKITPAKRDSDSDKPKGKTPRKRKISENDDSQVDNDQDRYEKKRYSAMLYQQYLNRSGPAHLGSKWIPTGKPDCLKGLCFIITGVLDSMQRDEAQTLITDHGGRCTQSVSGKVNYMVLGEDAGPTKVEKARKLGTKMISEDELIDLICTKSGIQNKNCPNQDENSSKDNEQEQKPNKKTEEKTVQKNKASSSSSSNSKETASSNTNSMKKGKIHSSDYDEFPESTTRNKTPNKKQDKPAAVTHRIKNENSLKQEVQKQTTQQSKQETKVSNDFLPLVDKYKPKDLTQIIGQQGERSNVKKLLQWLKNWQTNRSRNVPRPSPWAKDDDGAYYRAALLSGPPGVGKSTTAALVCQHLDFDAVEFNASDTRNKRMIREQVSQITSSKSLTSFQEGGTPSKRRVLLMDEVDGMSGNEDRGGMQELIALIKGSSIPIICMCNDRQHPKIRSLVNYCFDLRFSKPRMEQIRGAMMSICFREKIKMGADQLTQLIQSTGQDVRQTLNQLSLLSMGAETGASAAGDALGENKNNTEGKGGRRKEIKDVKLGPWEVVRKVFSAEEKKSMTLGDKSQLFFYDYSIGPLFVQENYLKVAPHCPKGDVLQRFAAAAEAISMGDVVDAQIRSSQSWSLLELQGMYASVLPGHYLSGHFAGQIDFPGWLGKNSRANKFKRLLTEVQAHSRTSTSGDCIAMALDYAPSLRDAIVGPLAREGAAGIPTSMAAMHTYKLLREDVTSLGELAHWPRSRDPFDAVDSKVKAAFTRTCNKDGPALPYAPSIAKAKKGAASQEDTGEYGEDDNAYVSDEPEDNDVGNDAMIKMKKPTASKASSKGKTASKEPARKKNSKQKKK